MRTRPRDTALAAALFALVLWAPAPATARDATVRSFDGTPIVTHFFPADGLAPGDHVPTVLLGHGWGGSGATDADGGQGEDTTGFVQLGDLRRAGWNVLTWDARGFGSSGGEAHVDSADFEARDVMALIDHVARQPEAALDAPGDPRLGMAGSSYGGGIQLVTAALDARIDALVPDIAWHSLRTSLYKERAPKFGWGGLLATGAAAAVLGGLASPGGPELGNVDPNLIRATYEVATTGQVSPETQAIFDGSEPMVERIRVPTLLTQGTVDTLFTLQEAIANYGILRGNGVPVKMIWHCSGHGLCDVPGGEPGHVERAVIRWFRRWLDGRETVNTGPRFEWVDTEGDWNGSDDYPLIPTELLSGELRAPATLAITPLVEGGTPITAESSPAAIAVPIGRAGGPVHAVGEPRLALTYRGTTAQAPLTHVYAQIVHRPTGNVLGNVATPIPVVLDDREHTIERPLEAIAARIGPDDALELQLVGGTLLYAPSRSAGLLTVTAARVEVPTGVPVPAPEVPLATGRRLLIRSVSRRASAADVQRRGGRLRFRVCASEGTVRLVRLVVKRRGRTVARSRLVHLRRCRTLTVRGWRTARPGRYTAVATGRDSTGGTVRATRAFRLR